MTMNARSPLAFFLALASTIAHASMPPLRTDSQIIGYTDRVVRFNKLYSNVGCLQYSADRRATSRIYVKAMELHSKHCGGDPSAQPLLFTILYDLRTGKVSTDKGSVDGAFHLIHAPTR